MSDLKIVVISDTHNWLDYLSIKDCIADGDVLVHCGDATMRGSSKEVQKFEQDFFALPHQHKIFVPGNHDSIYQNSNGFISREIPENCHYLHNASITIQGVKFYGTPTQHDLPGWAFYKPSSSALADYGRIPEDTDILITHVPPYGILDKVANAQSPSVKNQTLKSAGSTFLLEQVKRVRPSMHLFGHIHESRGWQKYQALHGVSVNCNFINAANFDEHYKELYPSITMFHQLKEDKK